MSIVKVQTANSIYWLDEENSRWRRSPKPGSENPYIDPDNPHHSNLTYNEWHKMDNWTVTDQDQLLVAYPDSECVFDNNGCAGNHFILTSIVQSIETEE